MLRRFPTARVGLGVALLLLAACERDLEGAPEAVATIRPLAFIVEPVLGSEVHVLLSPGVSPHTYDPRPSDARTAASAAVLFFGSMDLDAWAANLASRDKIALISLVSDSLLLHDHAGGAHADPHFWMDPLTVRSILPALADTLCVRSPDRCEAYRRRSNRFSEDLLVVHDSISVLVADIEDTPVLLSHPFLGYFARRYELSIAGIIEEIPGSEPTPKDMARMMDQVTEANAGAILTVPQHPSRAARAVSEATGVPIIELDPMGGGANGYADLLYLNVRKIRDAAAASPRNP